MSEPMIIIEPCAGLGNRLLGLGSAYAVAEKLNRRLVVMWKREVGCNIRFSELFDLPFEVVEISENGFKNEPVAQLLGNHAKKKWRKMADRFLECDDVEQVKETEGYEGLFHLIEQTPVIYLKAFGPICEVGAESYSFLKPGKNIEEKGDYLFRELTGNCVGVHVRRTDHTDAIANSPLALFAERMKKKLEADKETCFFVATDDKEVRRELKELLPDAKLIFPQSDVIDRDSKEGIEEAFVDMMNQELEKMGLSETTHFTNCVGIYNDDHYSTPYDMAMILKAAMDNDLCREVLGTRTYTTSKSKPHPDGITISNWFLRRIEDKDTHSEIIGAKTGFVNQSGSCAASMAQTPDGKEYICVTAGSTSSWRCIYDHVDIYDAFLPETAQPFESEEVTQ